MPANVTRCPSASASRAKSCILMSERRNLAAHYTALAGAPLREPRLHCSPCSTRTTGTRSKRSSVLTDRVPRPRCSNETTDRPTMASRDMLVLRSCDGALMLLLRCSCIAAPASGSSPTSCSCHWLHRQRSFGALSLVLVPALGCSGQACPEFSPAQGSSCPTHAIPQSTVLCTVQRYFVQTRCISDHPSRRLLA
ncbi:uncharacterized protein PV09_03356 [Verruconis gallopava]|uniref:Uncharacterized protein n=1 Tax=Verruconis gallopava TaxID=253628 RepID=A0A0D2B2H4_9PEZI|nr:uncharacterized protein PV09_03356 [Verruconis gallopava]KIW05469.1 hypothetical protein PV09_03356 [Verruconis gallopava]